MAIRKAAQAWLVVVAVLLAAAIAPSVVGQDIFGGGVIRGGGGTGDPVSINATLPANGGPPKIFVTVAPDLDCKVAVYAHINRAETWMDDVAWACVGQDTSATAAAGSHTWAISPAGLSCVDGDEAHVAVRVKTSDGNLIETLAQTFTLDGPGTITWHLWRSSHASATGAVTDGKLPNGEAAETAAFDHVYRDTDGSDMRYGNFRVNLPDSMIANTVQNSQNNIFVNSRAITDAAMSGTNNQSMVWFNLDRLAAWEGKRVAHAGLWLTADILVDYGTGLGFCARLDTVQADTVMLSTVSTRAFDPRWLNTTYNEVAAGQNIAWSPAWSARDDFSDLGPRSNWHAADVAVGASIRLDVTDPVQQYLYNRRDGVNGPFWLLNGSGSAAAPWECGNGTGATACPVLVVGVVENDDYVPAWGGRPGIPVAWAVDDGDTCHVTWTAILEGHGYKHTDVIFGNGGVDWTPASPGYKMTAAQWQAIRSSGNDISLHTWGHPDLGTYTTAAQFHGALRHSWIDSVFTDDAPVDTTDVEWSDFVWPVAGGEMTSTASIEYLQAYGYRSAWTPNAATFTPTGTTTYCSWDQPINVYLLAREATNTIFGDTEADVHTAAVIQDKFFETVDTYYHDRGRAALVLFAHDILSAPSGTPGYYANGVDHDQMEAWCDAVDGLPYVHVLTVEEITDLRFTGQQFVKPEPSFAGSMYLNTTGWANRVWMQRHN